MRLRRALAAVGLLLCIGCARRDYDGLCKLATEILTEPRVTPAMRPKRFFDDAPNVAFGKSQRAMVEALTDIPPARRYTLVLEEAHDAGLSDWTCPALESVLNPPVETSN